MMTRKSLTAWLAALLLAAAPALAATALAEGEWDGSVIQPDGAVEDVTFEVSKERGELRLTMAEDRGSVAFSDVRVEEDGDLVFSWRSGEEEMHCTLEPRPDGGFEGHCGDLRLAMSPPDD